MFWWFILATEKKGRDDVIQWLERLLIVKDGSLALLRNTNMTVLLNNSAKDFNIKARCLSNLSALVHFQGD